MILETPERRNEIVAEARSWIYTPFVNGGRTKGWGCDCGTLILMVFLKLGFITEADVKAIPCYRQDWFMHASENWYLGALSRHIGQVIYSTAIPTEETLPGNIIMLKPSRVSNMFCHGGIITAWPNVVHVKPPNVCESNIKAHRYFARAAEFAIFNPFVRPA